MSGRGRGRPPGPRPPSQKDLETPKIGQFFQQQPFAPIFQQRMGGGASQGAGSPHDHVDLTGASGESCSEDVTSSSAQHNTPTAAEARDSMQQFLATYIDSEESDGAPSSALPPSTAAQPAQGPSLQRSSWLAIEGVELIYDYAQEQTGRGHESSRDGLSLQILP